MISREKREKKEVNLRERDIVVDFFFISYRRVGYIYFFGMGAFSCFSWTGDYIRLMM